MVGLSQLLCDLSAFAFAFAFEVEMKIHLAHIHRLLKVFVLGPAVRCLLGPAVHCLLGPAVHCLLGLAVHCLVPLRQSGVRLVSEQACLRYLYVVCHASFS